MNNDYLKKPIDYEQEFVLSKIISSMQLFSQELFGLDFEIITQQNSINFSDSNDYCSQVISYKNKRYMFVVNIHQSILDKSSILENLTNKDNLSEKIIINLTQQAFEETNQLVDLTSTLAIDKELIVQFLRAYNSHKFIISSNDGFFECFFVKMTE